MKQQRDFGKAILLNLCASLVGGALVYLAMSYLFSGQEKQAEVIAAASSPDEQPVMARLGQQRQSPSSLAEYTQNESNNIDIYLKTNQAVVNITTWREVQVFNWFFEPTPRRDEQIGSGSIIDADGYILTNNHVVQNASKLLITLYDGSQFEGQTVGTDPENDLAIVRFDPQTSSDGRQLQRKLDIIAFTEQEELQVGQKVFAIGNPYGFERTLTVGIVSGLGRPIKNDNGLVIQDMIQTDASINPGNSGGPLLNSDGEMIGVNSSIYSPTGSSVGLGFAVPISTIKRVIPDLINYGAVRRGWIEMQAIPLFPQLVRYSQLAVRKGLLVSQVAPGSQAAKAGLRGGARSQAVRSGNQVIYLGGDIITKIGDTQISSMADLYSALEPTHPGQSVELTVVRNGKELRLSVKLSERKQSNGGS